ncbi:MAG: hypothetical protein WDW38_002226 [Sanguina aurantia]
MAELLDSLWCDLKTILSTSRHIASRHASEEWRKAGADVASRAAKFEAFLLSDKDTLAKLQVLEQRLCKARTDQSRQLAASASLQANLGQSAVAGVVAGSASNAVSSQAVGPDAVAAMLSAGQAGNREVDSEAMTVYPAAAAAAAAAAAEELADQLQLCRLLLVTHTKGGMAAGDDDPGSIIRHVAVSQGTEQLQQLSALERQAVAALQAALSDPGSAPLLDLHATVFQLSQDSSPSRASDSHAPESDDTPDLPMPMQDRSSSSSRERAAAPARVPKALTHAAASKMQMAAAAAAAAAAGIHLIQVVRRMRVGRVGVAGQGQAVSREKGSWLQGAAVVGRGTGGPSAGSDAGQSSVSGLPTRSAPVDEVDVAHADDTPPAQGLRSAAYQAGVQEMRQRAVVGCSGVGAARAAAAECVGASSYAAHTQERRSRSGAESVVEMLVGAAERVKPDADSQALLLPCDHLQASLGHPALKLFPSPGGLPRDSCGPAASCTGSLLPSLSHHPSVCHHAPLAAAQALLSPHLTLQGLLQGLNDLLQHHWADSPSSCSTSLRTAVSAVVVGACHMSQTVVERQAHTAVRLASLSAAPGTSSTAGPEPAGDVAVTVPAAVLPQDKGENAVVGPAMRPRGVLYVDPGAGGYGTRQLGFCRDAPSAERPSFLPAGVEQRYGVQDAQQMEEALWGLPVVSVGLQWAWREGRAGELRTLQQLSVCGAARPSHSNKVPLSPARAHARDGPRPSHPTLLLTHPPLHHLQQHHHHHHHQQQQQQRHATAPNSDNHPSTKHVATVATIIRNTTTIIHGTGIISAPTASTPSVPSIGPTTCTTSLPPLPPLQQPSPRQRHPKHFGGLHLPLHILEVPSTLFERLIMDERSLAVILRAVPQRHALAGGGQAAAAVASGGGEGSGSAVCPTAAAAAAAAAAAVRGLAEYYRASVLSPLAVQEQILCALLDQLVNMAPAAAMQQRSYPGSSCEDNQDPTMSPSWILDMIEQIWSSYSSMPSLMYGSIKQLAVLPVASHHQATYHSYISASVAAQQVWERHLAADPCSSSGSQAVRSLLLEQGARTPPDRFLSTLLGEGSLLRSDLSI